MSRAGLRLWMILGLIGFARNSMAEGLPDPAEIQAEVMDLGAAQSEVRISAREQLEGWGTLYPRYLLQTLGEVYAGENDLERRYQLKVLLRDLAARCLFFKPRAFLGVNFNFEVLADGTPAIRLVSVIPASAAEKAGLKDNDLILAVDGMAIDNSEGPDAFATLIRSYLPMETVEFRILRKQTFNVAVTLAYRPFQPHEINSQIRSEYRKIDSWLQNLRNEHSGQATEEPVGYFRLD